MQEFGDNFFRFRLWSDHLSLSALFAFPPQQFAIDLGDLFQLVLQLVVVFNPLASGYKSSRFICLEIPLDFSWESTSPKACKMGTCSKSVTLSTCRISCRLPSSANRFLTMATST